ncbi:MAG: tripartite tricarboxylate transporter permease [Rhodobacterales bacterium]|nr:tripartite tricarboxylate transporter permease [Rhodobacterales bacterium]
MEFLTYFGEVFTPLNALFLLLGTVGGLLLGATPGLSPTMAVALLIPFTFHMEPASGLILLGAAYTSTVAGGAVSAILLKIPGAPANIATTLDGHVMAQQGRAAEALHYCFISSGIGGVLGIFVLIFFTPMLAGWALSFGPSHMFWIAILGVTVIASLDAGGSLIRGMIAGCIGLWISTIGYDEIQGVERFVFSSHLEGGINVIAALIGLFAIPQVLAILEKGRAKRNTNLFDIQPQSFGTSLRICIGKVKALTIGSVVGIIVGLIPGAGGQIAGLVAYDQTRKLSRNPDAFGKGESEGVIAAESANNAMVGPSLVPLLTLSVPGSPTAAVLLGGLLIHGIFPGPNLFNDYPDVAWTFIDSLLVGQILMVVFGIGLSRVAAQVIRIPESVLAGAVTVLALFGTFSVQHSYSDVIVMLVLGVAMYWLGKYKFSSAPLVLGIVLGPIAETNYVQGAIIADSQDGLAAYFLTGTLNLVLIGVCLASVAYSVVMEVRRRKVIRHMDLRKRMPRPTFPPEALVLAAAVALIWISFTADQDGAYLFPQVIAVAMALCAMAGLFSCYALGASLMNEELGWVQVRNLALGLGLIVLYVLVADTLGFYLSGALIFAALAVLYDPAGRSPRLLMVRGASALGFMIVIYLLFDQLLRVQAPRGIFL